MTIRNGSHLQGFAFAALGSISRQLRHSPGRRIQRVRRGGRADRPDHQESQIHPGPGQRGAGASGSPFQVHNADPTPEEFESADLKVEKIVVGGSMITVNVGPQKPGVYAFFGDYNPDSAKGVLHVVAK